jgi:hypothetical protein
VVTPRRTSEPVALAAAKDRERLRSRSLMMPLRKPVAIRIWLSRRSAISISHLLLPGGSESPTRRVARAVVEAAIVAALAAGCGPRLMNMKFSIPPDRTEPQFEQDRYECLQQHDHAQKFQACLQVRGYSLVSYAARRFVPVTQF